MGFLPQWGNGVRPVLRPTWAALVTERWRVCRWHSVCPSGAALPLPTPPCHSYFNWLGAEESRVVLRASSAQKTCSFSTPGVCQPWVWVWGAGWSFRGARTPSAHSSRTKQAPCNLHLCLSSCRHHLGHPPADILPFTSCEIKPLLKNEISETIVLAPTPCPKLRHIEEV